jgi:hypothetical protein
VTVKRPGDRLFGLVFSGLFGVIAVVAFLVTGGWPEWSVALSAGLLGLALCAPGLLMPLNRLWSRLGARIGFVSNHLLLGVFYFGIVVPFGLMSQLFRLSSLRKRPDPAAASYWTPVGRQATADTYPDQF